MMKNCKFSHILTLNKSASYRWSVRFIFCIIYHLSAHFSKSCCGAHTKTFERWDVYSSRLVIWLYLFVVGVCEGVKCANFEDVKIKNVKFGGRAVN